MKNPSFLHKRGIPLGLGLLSLVLLFLPLLPEPTEAEAGFGVFLGRFHPLLVHFPIVLIVIPLLLEGLRRLGNWNFDRRLMPLMLGLGILSALISALAGYLLYGSGDYSGELVRRHLWGGVLLAVGMNLCGLAFYYRWNRLLMVFLLLTNGLLLYTGHMGGSLTHGESYLTELWPEWGQTETPIEQKPLAELNVFDDIVMAIFDAKCLACHNEQKAKGKLVMSSFAALQKGGSSGEPMAIGGNLKASLLHQRIALPLTDEDHMPPSGKAQLSPEEEQLINWWIASGASEEQLVGERTAGDTIKQALDQYLPQIAHRQRVQIQNREERDALAKKLVPLVEELGLELAPDPETDSLLFAISMKLPAERITDADLVELLPYAHAISRISLVSAEITDDGLHTLSQMPELRRLVLAKTCIDGSGLAYLERLNKLEVLNLSDTSVDDVTVLNLLNLSSLKEVYLYGSDVSLNVIAALQEYLPGTEVLPAEGGLY
jgi:uncharacterized membrane protein